MKMSKIRIEGHLYDTTKLNEKIKTYDFDETTTVSSLLNLINDQADEIISLKTKCLKLEEEKWYEELKSMSVYDPEDPYGDEMRKEADWDNNELVRSAVNKVKRTIH